MTDQFSSETQTKKNTNKQIHWFSQDGIELFGTIYIHTKQTHKQTDFPLF